MLEQNEVICHMETWKRIKAVLTLFFCNEVLVLLADDQKEIRRFFYLCASQDTLFGIIHSTALLVVHSCTYFYHVQLENY